MKIRYAKANRHEGDLIKLTLVIDGDISAIADEINKINAHPNKYEVEIKETSKRSLTANSYAWSLISKLAKRLSVDKNTIYRELVRDMPVSTMVLVKNSEADALTREWESRGQGWQTEEMPSDLEGYKVFALYKGSSEFTPSEMSMFIDLIIYECKEQNIDIDEDSYTAKPHH